MKYKIIERGYETPCWIWQMSKTRKGYGRVKFNGRSEEAHRVFYEAKFGPLSGQLHHKCHQKACVNPDHLAVVTPLEHKQEHLVATCRRGHDASEIYYWGKKRCCRACARLAYRKRVTV